MKTALNFNVLAQLLSYLSFSIEFSSHSIFLVSNLSDFNISFVYTILTLNDLKPSELDGVPKTKHWNRIQSLPYEQKQKLCQRNSRIYQETESKSSKKKKKTLINALCPGDQTIPPGTPVSTLYNGDTSKAIIGNICPWVFFLFFSPHSPPFLTYLVLLQAYWEHSGVS